ncbi:ABC transporter permease [Rhodococcus koreensis]|uniref:ABC transporter permease n=1 Tax=Rhodococcus koreensis TaxID=99653 RepID=UPI00366B9935
MTALDLNPAPPSPPQSGAEIRRSRFNGFLWSSRFASVVAVVAVLVPLAVMLIKVFMPDGTLDLEALSKVWAQPWLGSMLVDTLVTVFLGACGALIVGALFAWINERTNARLGWLGETLPVVPLFMPPLASAIGWVLLGMPGPGVLNSILTTMLSWIGIDAGPEGPINIFSWPGVVFLFSVNLLPHVYLVVSAALRNLDPALEEAARMNGSGPTATLWKVTIPAIKPAMISGALLALAAGFALFSVPFLIGTPAGVDNLTVRVVNMTTNAYPPALDEATVLGLVVVFLIGSTWLIQRRVNRLARHSTMTGKTSSPSRVDLGLLAWPARIVMIAYICAAVVLPAVALVFVSLQSYWTGKLTLDALSLEHYTRLFSPSSSTYAALQNSIVLAIVTASIALLVTALIAYYGERNPSSILGRVADGVTKLPAALSHVVIAVALIVTLAGPPFGLQGTLVLLLIGYLIMYLPQAGVAASSALAQIGPTMSEASLMSSASQGRTFRKVVLPLMAPGLVSGWVLVFVLTAGDLTASVMLSSPRTPVVGFVMLDLSTSGTYGVVAALGVIITLISATVGSLALAYGRRARGGPRRNKE